MAETNVENGNEYEFLVKILQEKYGGENKAGSLTEIYADNPKYAARIKAMGRKSKELFGTTLAQYFKQVGIIGKNVQAEEERLAEEARKVEEERLAEEARKAEEERLAAEARKAEEERLAAEARKAEEERLAAEARRAEEEFRRKAEEERIAEEARRAEEERLAAEARRLEAERLEAERRRVEEEKKAELERKKREDEQKMYELEYSAWVRMCNKRRNEREKEYKRRIQDRREELEYELELKRDNEIKAVMEEMIKYMRQLVDAEWTLDSLGIFDFKGKKAQNASIALAEAKIEEAKREIKSVREAYKNEIPSIDVKMKLEEVRIRQNVENDFILPEEPRKPE